MTEDREEPTGDWAPSEWAVFILLVLAHLAVGTITVLVVTFDTEGVCRRPAEAGELERARLVFAVLVAASVGVWLLALRRSRHRSRLVVAMLLVCAWPTLKLIQALVATRADWTMDWCLF